MDSSGGDVAAWRSRILDNLLLALTVLAVVPVALTVRAQILGERFLPFGLVLLIGWVCLAGLTMWRSGPYRPRAVAVLVIFFAVGAYVLYEFGLRSGGRLSLVTSAALATVFFGWRAGALAMVAAIIATGFVGLGHAHGWWVPVEPAVSQGQSWINATFALMLMGGAVVLSTGFLTTRLQGNVRELTRAQQQLAERAAVLEAVSAISQGLLHGTRWDQDLDARLARLGEGLGVDRLSVVECCDGRLRLRGQWCAPGIKAWPAAELSIADNQLQPFVDTLARGEIFVSDPRRLPAPARELAGQIGMASGVSYPIRIEGELWGFMGLTDATSETDWSPFHDILGATAASLGAAIARDRLRAEREQRAQQLEERVAERTAELEALSHSVSHDLRAPLRHITGYAELLREHMGDSLDAEGGRLLATIESAVARMNRQMEHLLSFARMGRQAIKPEVLDLAPMVGELMDELARGRTIDWRVGELPPVRGDRTLVRQVLANLLGNAVKFTAHSDPAVIEVSGDSAGSEVEIRVADNGAGFDPRYADKLFGVFQRLHNADEYEGTGIGLALSKRIVDRHGGRIEAEGQPDQGATFRFTLPRG